jgi:hypothetical protein
VVDAGVPPALGRDLLEAVLAAAEHFPELLHGLGARITAGQADDGDIVIIRRIATVVSRRQRRHEAVRNPRGRSRPDVGHSGLRVQAGDQSGPVFLDQVTGHTLQIDVFEKQGLGQRAEQFLQLQDHVYGHDRIETVLLELFLRPDLLRIQLQHPAENGLQQRHRPRLQTGHIDGHHCRRRSRGLRFRAQVPAQRVALAIGQRNRAAMAGCEDCGKRAQTGFGRQRQHAAAAHRCDAGGRHAHATVGPQGPVDGDGAATALAGARPILALFGVGIEESVGDAVVGLTGTTVDCRHRGEQQQKVEPDVAGGVVDMLHATHLRCEHGGHLPFALVGDEGVVEHAGAVDDAIQHAVLVDDGGDHAAHVGGIADVGCEVIDREIVGRRAGTAAEYQPDVTGPCQFAGDDLAQSTATAGDPVDPRPP